MRRIIFNLVTKVYPWYLRVIYKMNIGSNTIVSPKSRLDKSINPKGIHIGNNCWILRNSIVLAHDHCRSLKTDTFIGDNCVIGVNSIVLPGIKIGNHVIVGAGAVVTKDVPNHCVVAGNPAKIIREGVTLNDRGQIIN